MDEEFAFLLKSLKDRNIDRLWVAFEDLDEEECAWENYTPKENCLYLQEYIAKAGKFGIRTDILAFTYNWIQTFKTK